MSRERTSISFPLQASYPEVRNALKNIFNYSAFTEKTKSTSFIEVLNDSIKPGSDVAYSSRITYLEHPASELLWQPDLSELSLYI